jgi:hypothetical protein
MKEIIIQIGTSVVCLVLATAFYYLARFIHNKCEQLKAKTESEALKSLLEKIDYIVQIAVEATNQTFVEDKKKNCDFNADAQQQAFNQTFTSIENMLTDDDREKIINAFGDMGTFLRSSVENYIRNSKNI